MMPSRNRPERKAPAPQTGNLAGPADSGRRPVPVRQDARARYFQQSFALPTAPARQTIVMAVFISVGGGGFQTHIISPFDQARLSQVARARKPPARAWHHSDDERCASAHGQFSANRCSDWRIMPLRKCPNLRSDVVPREEA